MKLARLSESLAFRTVICALGVALLTLAVLFTVATPANAWVLSGYHYDLDSIDPIQYRFFSVGSSYVTAFHDGEAAWDATSAPGYFGEHSWSFDPEIEVYDDAYEWTDWARTEATVTPPDPTWDGNEVRIKFNTTQMDSFTAYEKKIVAEHELGHAYGLDENNNQGCVVMKQGADKFTCGSMPTDDDVAGVEAIY